MRSLVPYSVLLVADITQWGNLVPSDLKGLTESPTLELGGSGGGGEEQFWGFHLSQTVFFSLYSGHLVNLITGSRLGT